MKVFISGPMKGYPNFNKEAFDQAEKELIQQGYTVFNPAWMDFSGEWTKQDKRAIDAAIMSRCDAVYQLPGWDGLGNSGSRMECAFAQGAALHTDSQKKFTIYEAVLLKFPCPLLFLAAHFLERFWRVGRMVRTKFGGIWVKMVNFLPICPLSAHF